MLTAGIYTYQYPRPKNGPIYKHILAYACLTLNNGKSYNRKLTKKRRKITFWGAKNHITNINAM